MNAPAPNRFEAALQRPGPLVLDGGLATQLEAQGHDIGTRLWSAELLISNPRAIVDAHLAFLEAGAECIISASYQASCQGFEAAGLSHREADRMIVRSVELAFLAREEFLASREDAPFEPLVAASVGPWGAAQHDGSEYRGDYGISSDALKAFHGPRLRLLDAAGADVLACETVPDRIEAEVLADLLSETATVAWMSFSCRDGRRISDGTPLAALAARLRDHPSLRALGINCTPPRYVESLIGCIRTAAPHMPIVVYPNSGEAYDVSDNRWSGESGHLDFGRAARTWRRVGASIIGGCCRTDPSEIQAIRRAMNEPLRSPA